MLSTCNNVKPVSVLPPKIRALVLVSITMILEIIPVSLILPILLPIWGLTNSRCLFTGNVLRVVNFAVKVNSGTE